MFSVLYSFVENITFLKMCNATSQANKQKKNLPQSERVSLVQAFTGAHSQYQGRNIIRKLATHY